MSKNADEAARLLEARILRTWKSASETIAPEPPKSVGPRFDPTDLVLGIACAILSLAGGVDPTGLVGAASFVAFAGLAVTDDLLRRGNERLPTRTFVAHEHRRLRRGSVAFAVVAAALLGTLAALSMRPFPGLSVDFATPLAAMGALVLTARSLLRVREARNELASEAGLLADDHLLVVEPEYRRSIAAQVVALSLTIVGALSASAYAYHVESSGALGARDLPNRVLVVGHAGDELSTWLADAGFEVRQRDYADASEAAAMLNPANPDLRRLADEHGFGFLAYDLGHEGAAREIGKELSARLSEPEVPAGSTFAVVAIGDLDTGDGPTFGAPLDGAAQDELEARRLGLLGALYEQPRLRAARRDCITDRVFGDIVGCQRAMAFVDRSEADQIRARRRHLQSLQALESTDASVTALEAELEVSEDTQDP